VVICNLKKVLENSTWRVADRGENKERIKERLRTKKNLKREKTKF
jgi:hypothetical protein